MPPSDVPPRRPVPSIPPADVDFHEDTGQHVRVQLEEVKGQLREAIAIDRADHKQMIESGDERHRRTTVTLNDHGKQLRELQSKVGIVQQSNARIEGTLTGMSTTLDLLATSAKHRAQESHLKVVNDIEVQGAEKKAAVDDKADKRKRIRGLIFDWLSKLGIVGIGAVAGILTTRGC